MTWFSSRTWRFHRFTLFIATLWQLIDVGECDDGAVSFPDLLYWTYHISRIAHLTMIAWFALLNKRGTMGDSPMISLVASAA
jgi:hypothetical protein